jgi:hypothetical protein
LPRKKKPQQYRSEGEIILELFFSSSGIVHMKSILEKQLNKHHYKEIFTIFAIQFVVSELWCKENWLLLHDSGPAHCSVLVQEEWAKQ